MPRFQNFPEWIQNEKVAETCEFDNLGSWVRLPWLAHDEAPGLYITIPQYQFNKTKQHTEKNRCSMKESWASQKEFWDEHGGGDFQVPFMSSRLV